ncbi:hypothetical protein [Microbacterium panaciterrae]|uniref:Uncharacterized protein n=1 Tax=Microbacterium panaciterrae TaxID=985759 RepID=A0ABP8PM23_9MICO
MTESIASPTPFRSHAHVRAIRKSTDRAVAKRPGRAARFALWAWFPREILHRGGIATRDTERAYRDLQTAQDRSGW